MNPAGPEVVTLGECLVSFVASEPGPLAVAATFRAYPAGAEANVAVGLARLGRRVAFVGRVGDDGLGTRILRALRGEGVDVEGLAVDRAGPTGRDDPRAARALGPAEVFYARAGSAGSRLASSDVGAAEARGDFAAARWLHLTGITPALSPSCRAAIATALDDRAGDGADGQPRPQPAPPAVDRGGGGDDPRRARGAGRRRDRRRGRGAGRDRSRARRPARGARRGAPRARAAARGRSSSGSRGRSGSSKPVPSPVVVAGAARTRRRRPGRGRRRVLRGVHRRSARRAGTLSTRSTGRTRVGLPRSSRKATRPGCRPVPSWIACSLGVAWTRFADVRPQPANAVGARPRIPGRTRNSPPASGSRACCASLSSSQAVVM